MQTQLIEGSIGTFGEAADGAISPEMRYRRPLAVVGVVAAVALLAGLMLGEARHADATGLPACATSRSHSLALPRGLASFPLPLASVVDVSSREFGFTFVHGDVPGYINPVRDYLLSHVRAAGYRMTQSDSEAAEADGAFSGHGVRGRYKLRQLVNCPGALAITIAVQ